MRPNPNHTKIRALSHGLGLILGEDLPPRHFLSAGANYRLIGYTYSGSDVLQVNASSGLHAALQCTVEGDACVFPRRATLSSTLACFAWECSMDSVRMVKITTYLGGNFPAVAYYRYEAPVRRAMQFGV